MYPCVGSFNVLNGKCNWSIDQSCTVIFLITLSRETGGYAIVVVGLLATLRKKTFERLYMKFSGKVDNEQIIKFW